MKKRGRPPIPGKGQSAQPDSPYVRVNITLPRHLHDRFRADLDKPLSTAIAEMIARKLQR